MHSASASSTEGEFYGGETVYKSLLVLSAAALIIISFLFTGIGGSAAEDLPEWSTYHDYEMVFADIGDQGFILGMTSEGTIFFLDRQSRFISSWNRENSLPEELILSRAGFEALALYEDGYTTLFTHDREDGDQPWAYTIENMQPHASSLSPDGERIAVVSSSTEELEGEKRSRQSLLWLFDRDGEQIFRREVESRILTLDMDESYWLVAAGDRIGSEETPRGRRAVYLFDQYGYLAWDYELQNAPEKVGFIGEEAKKRVALLTEAGEFFLFDLGGEVIFSREEIQTAVWSSGPYAALEISGQVLLCDSDGEVLWQRTAEDLDLLAVDGKGKTAAVFGRTLMLRDKDGDEVLNYEAEARIRSLGLSSSGEYLVMGSDRINFFRLED